VRTIETSDFERRLAALEGAVADKKHHRVADVR
jgi:hypothetical protein